MTHSSVHNSVHIEGNYLSTPSTPPAMTRSLVLYEALQEVFMFFLPRISPSCWLCVAGFAISTILYMHPLIIFNSPLPDPYHQSLSPALCVFHSLSPLVSMVSTLGQPLPAPWSPCLQAIFHISMRPSSTQVPW